MCNALKQQPSVFQIVDKEQKTKELEKLAQFLYKNLPEVKMNYTLNKIVNNVAPLCES